MARARAVLAPPRLHEKTREDWMRVLRFCVVGGSGYVVNLLVFAALVHGADMHYVPAAILSFCVAVTNNFLLNKYWTFQRHDERAHTQGIRYLLVSLLALGLNLLLLQGLVTLGLSDVPANALAVIAVTPVNFLVNHRWTFPLVDGRAPIGAGRRGAEEGDRAG
jgi:dolichol-phosphate mannosyltransferase